MGPNAVSAAIPRGQARSTHRSHSHHGRVLLVEDEPDQAAILEAVLRHEGLDVVVASSGELTGYAGGLAAKRWLLEHEQQLTASALTLRGIEQVTSS